MSEGRHLDDIDGMVNLANIHLAVTRAVYKEALSTYIAEKLMVQAHALADESAILDSPSFIEATAALVDSQRAYRRQQTLHQKVHAMKERYKSEPAYREMIDQLIDDDHLVREAQKELD